MSKLNKFENISVYFGIFIGSILTDIAYDYLKDHGFTNYILVLFLFIILVLSIQIVSSICRAIINESSVVRRIILRRDYIEGLWLDIAKGSSSDSFGLYMIRYADSSYHITGEEYNLDGKVIYSWQSMMSSFDGDRLTYLYATHSHISDAVEENFGITELTFNRQGPNQFPRTATGYFIDAATKFRRVVTTAEKLSNHNLKIVNNLQGKDQIIRGWINKSKLS